MSSASAIADALVTMLSAASVFGSGNVNKNSYKVLETAACSAAVISLNSVRSVAVAFGNDRERTWSMGINAYIKDTGDPSDALNRVFNIADKVVACLDADDTILGTIDKVTNISITRNENKFTQAGGSVWLPVDIVVELTEL